MMTREIFHLRMFSPHRRPDTRRADGKPLSNVEIAAAIVAAKGYGEDSMPALIRRVRANLSYLRKHGQVTKTGDRLTPSLTTTLVQPPASDSVCAPRVYDATSAASVVASGM